MEQDGGTWCVLDIECSPDGEAARMARRPTNCATGLVRIDAVGLLFATERPDGSWTTPRLRCIGPDADEFETLMTLDEALAGLPADARIATFNGVRHDLPVIARRAARHWMFGLPGLERLSGCLHADLNLQATWPAGRRRPSLVEACAGLGIPTDALLIARDDAMPRVRRKAETDVVATFLLLLFEIALRRRDPRPLVAGWTALREAGRSANWKAPHLAQFMRSEMLDSWSTP